MNLKTASLMAALAIVSGVAHAQPSNPATLTEPVLSAYETRQIYAQAKLIVKPGAVLDECGNEVTPTVEKLDLGLPAAAILLTIPDEACFSKFDKSANKYMLFQRQGTTFKSILTMTGNAFTPVDTTTSGVTDIQVGAVGVYVPTWKWDGNKYSYGTALKSDIKPSATTIPNDLPKF
jgi:hypothetical protein